MKHPLTLLAAPLLALSTIGKVEFVAENESVITVANIGTVGFVILDAIQLTPLK